MDLLQEAPIVCPYCGEVSTLLLDASIAQQQYTEDCAVCCRPMVVATTVDERGRSHVAVRREDEA